MENNFNESEKIFNGFMKTHKGKAEKDCEYDFEGNPIKNTEEYNRKCNTNYLNFFVWLFVIIIVIIIMRIYNYNFNASIAVALIFGIILLNILPLRIRDINYFCTMAAIITISMIYIFIYVFGKIKYDKIKID